MQFCIWGRKAEFTQKYGESEGSGFKLCSTSEFFDPAEKYIVDGHFILKCHASLIVERENEDDEVPWDAGSISSTYNAAGKNFKFIVGEDSIEVSFCFVL